MVGTDYGFRTTNEIIFDFFLLFIDITHHFAYNKNKNDNQRKIKEKSNVMDEW